MQAARIFGLPSVLSALAALFLYVSAFGAAAAEATFETAPLQIITAKGKIHRFTVELALDNNQRAQGLMYRRHMPRDHGMLFDFGVTRRVMMWMKNTYLPLDMLFIARDGKIETVRENAVPQSEALVDSKVPVAYVLELNAGTASRLGLAPGDVVDTAIISSPRP